MKRRTILIGLLLAMLLFGSVSAALAIASPSYILISDTAQGGGAGGGVAGSASYHLESTLGGAVLVSSASASRSACSGFLCSGIQFFRKLFLPLTIKP